MKEIIINSIIVFVSVSAYISLLELIKRSCRSYLKKIGFGAL